MISRREMVRSLLAVSAGAAVAVVPAAAQAGGGRRPTGASATLNSGYDFEPVRKRILDAVAQGQATGVAVAVAQRGRIIWEEGFGWANREEGRKVTEHTPFSLASITKPFTTTTLMTLVAEGKIALEDPANKYLSKSKLVGPNGNPDGATVRLLGAHAGGLPSMFERYFQGDGTQAPTAEALLRDYGRLAYPPGCCYEYSNVGFVALGAIASNVTGTDFGTLMTRRLLEPLGMNDSFFGANAERLRVSAVRYDDSGKPIPYYTTSTPPSGELYASSHDLARFAMFTLKDHLQDQSRILDDHWIDELHKPVFSGPAGTASAFGWFTGHTKSGLPVVFKGGGQPGVATILHLVPSERLACLVLTNRSENRESAFSFCNQILATILPQWSQLSESIGLPHSSFVATPDFAGRWEGTLTDGGAHMRVKLEIASSETATLALGDKPPEKITDAQSEGSAFTGKTVGAIESPDAIRNAATTLSLKLIPQDARLVGRILASAKSPGTSIPYVLTLSRSAN